jgi:hypothetical protein
MDQVSKLAKFRAYWKKMQGFDSIRTQSVKSLLKDNAGLWRGSFRSICIALLVVMASASLLGEQPRAGESEVKAAFLYNFGKFVKWPSSSVQSTFAICILGRDPFGAQLDSIVAGESVDAKPISVRRVTNVQEAATCRILFISSSEQNRLHALLPALSKAPVLTVSDIPQFIEHGGMIQFVLEQGRVRFEVNLGSAENSGLSMSSELLKVATQVKRGRD